MKINDRLVSRIIAIIVIILSIVGCIYCNLLLWIVLIGITAFALFVDKKKHMRRATMWLLCFTLILEVIGILSKSGVLTLNTFGRTVFESGYMDIVFVLSALLYVHMYMDRDKKSNIKIYSICRYALCYAILVGMIVYGIVGFTRNYSVQYLDEINHGDKARIISYDSGYALTANADNELYFSEPDGSQYQVFTFEIAENGVYTILDYKNNAIDIYEWKIENGATIGCWEDAGQDNQRWTVYDTGLGYFCIVSKIDTNYMMSNLNNQLKLTSWSGPESVFFVFEQIDQYKNYFQLQQYGSGWYIFLAVIASIIILCSLMTWKNRNVARIVDGLIILGVALMCNTYYCIYIPVVIAIVWLVISERNNTISHSQKLVIDTVVLIILTFCGVYFGLNISANTSKIEVSDLQIGQKVIMFTEDDSDSVLTVKNGKLCLEELVYGSNQIFKIVEPNAENSDGLHMGMKASNGQVLSLRVYADAAWLEESIDDKTRNYGIFYKAPLGIKRLGANMKKQGLLYMLIIADILDIITLLGYPVYNWLKGRNNVK